MKHPLLLLLVCVVLGRSAVRGDEAPKSGGASFADLAHELVFTSLSFSPTSATTEGGLHRWTDPETGQELDLDTMLDDFSPAALEHRQAYYEDFAKRLHAIAKEGLDAQTQVDYELLDNAVAFALYRLTEEMPFRQRPQDYAENLGNALFGPMSLEYADAAARASHFVARLEKVPAFLDQAKENLTASNEIYRQAAVEATEGVVAVIEELGPPFVAGTPSAEGFEKAKGPALAALQAYREFIVDELPQRKRPPAKGVLVGQQWRHILPKGPFGEVDWRMGQERFAAKWRYYLQVSFGPDEMLEIAEKGMRDTRAEMLELAQPLHDAWFPDHRHDPADAEAYLNQVVREVLDRVQDEHTGRGDLVAQTMRDVEAIEAFIKSHHVLSMTDYPNLEVIPTPEFMRASYSIAGAVFAPALEPGLSTFYWVTPIPDGWSDEQAEGRLREYNKYKMLTLSVHEAVPGHAVQGLYANHVTPEWRRLLRTIYGNTPYIEGWAVYAELMMEEMGLDGGDPVKMRLISLKAMLRVYANAIIDIRLHTREMPEEEAVDLMIRQGFQERPEAVGKLRRAQLDYVQLQTYLAGLREWTSLRHDAEAREGKAFDLARFHDTVLLYGPIPVPMVRQLYFAGVAPTATMAPASGAPPADGAAGESGAPRTP